MPQSLDEEIRTLRSHYWSTRDPDGRAFAPLAEAYRRKGDLEEAGSLLRDGLGRLPEFASGHLVAARVCRDREERVEARDHLDRVLDLDPENVLALLERADLVRAEGDREQAMHDLQTLLELEPDHPDAQSALEALEESALWRSGAEEGPQPDPSEEPRSGTTDVGASTFPEPAGTGSVGASDEIEMAWDADPFGIEEDFGLEADEPGAPETDPEAGRSEVVEADFEIEEIEVEADAEGGEVTPEPAGVEEDELDDPDRSLFTRTMGEVYARQGFVDRAVDIYSHLLARAPDDEEIASRLAELRARHPDAGGGSERAKPVSPDPEAEEPEVASTSEGVRTIGDYFQDLLAWVPGAVPIESLAPDAVPIESLTPDAVQVANLAPDQETVGTTTRPAEGVGKWAGITSA
ncbi:MAG: tetratricopeptide repeat protein, partial [Gemmatimonadota bacterium]